MRTQTPKMYWKATRTLCWLVLLTLCLRATEVRPVRLQQMSRPGHSHRLRHFRRLFSSTQGNLSAGEAEGILREYGIENFGTVVSAVRSSVIDLESLPAPARGQLFVLCRTLGALRNCSIEEQQSLQGSADAARGPLFQFACENQTCMESWPPQKTACILDSLFGAPASNSTREMCSNRDMGMGNSSGPSLSTPPSLLPVGDVENMFAGLLGLPNGTEILSNSTCKDGKPQTDVFAQLGDEPFVMPGESFRCIWDGRCRDTEGCCDMDQSASGEFICYQPGGVQGGVASAATANGGQCALVVLASMLIGWYGLTYLCAL
ncbi:unnamed protein product [Ostreobium quekettii]|uniref:Uncharacterized protein n=1 Tax=Ostreobium quekettii TaxID=121088 RepID=A0A8S1J6I3_9CHLO|nr:unnamed protein product [Ostreobium quekettii]